MPSPDSFPRQSARTQRFTLGAPRNIAVAPDGALVAFLRSAGPEDPVTALWVLDLPAGAERCIADPRLLLAEGGDDLPPEERARRERARESAAGITAYATDGDHRVAVAALAGRLVLADLRAGTSEVLDVPGPVVDPRPDPTGSRVAWAHDRGLWVAELGEPASARVVARDADPLVRWGVAEFVAAEEMDRFRGYWWSPDGSALLAARVDDTPVDRWWIADPAAPDRPPNEVAYPAAGTPNAAVGAWIVPLDGTPLEVEWDHDAWPYLAHGTWDSHGPLVALFSRDQRSFAVAAVDPTTGATKMLWEDRDRLWVERAAGTPERLADGRLVVVADRDGTRRLLVGGEPVTPEDLCVRLVSQVDADRVVFAAGPLDDATSRHVWSWHDGHLTALSSGDGVHAAAVGGAVVVLQSSTLDTVGARTQVVDGPVIASHAARPLVEPNVTIHHLGKRHLATALLLPHDAPPDVRLPVLLDPYGGPHAQRVVRSRAAHLSSQWFADQGFAVVVVDGRGTPGRGTEWERAIHLDLAEPVLEDQLDALSALAEIEPRLDLSRVAIRGWSFGGYLAALAVLRRPDAVHAAIAGAPVTDWRLYDTFYTERYLGMPDDPADPGVYARSSLLDDAVRLTRPLMLIHGLADDNVVSAHTLRLSSRLLAHGRPHQVLPLTGVTHMASEEDVAENLLLLQLDFLRRALSLPAPGVATAPASAGVAGAHSG
ncbi:MAG: prolyl oligopeptidase family serine peptidase [Microthrixaceae bacterium]